MVDHGKSWFLVVFFLNDHGQISPGIVAGIPFIIAQVSDWCMESFRNLSGVSEVLKADLAYVSGGTLGSKGLYCSRLLVVYPSMVCLHEVEPVLCDHPQ